MDKSDLADYLEAQRMLAEAKDEEDRQIARLRMKYLSRWFEFFDTVQEFSMTAYEHRLRSLLESHPDYLLDTDADTLMSIWHDQAKADHDEHRIHKIEERRKLLANYRKRM